MAASDQGRTVASRAQSGVMYLHKGEQQSAGSAGVPGDPAPGAGQAEAARQQDGQHQVGVEGCAVHHLHSPAAQQAVWHHLATGADPATQGQADDGPGQSQADHQVGLQAAQVVPVRVLPQSQQLHCTLHHNTLYTLYLM